MNSHRHFSFLCCQCSVRVLLAVLSLCALMALLILSNQNKTVNSNIYNDYTNDMMVSNYTSDGQEPQPLTSTSMSKYPKGMFYSFSSPGILLWDDEFFSHLWSPLYWTTTTTTTNGQQDTIITNDSSDKVMLLYGRIEIKVDLDNLLDHDDLISGITFGIRPELKSSPTYDGQVEILRLFPTPSHELDSPMRGTIGATWQSDGQAFLSQQEFVMDGTTVELALDWTPRRLAIFIDDDELLWELDISDSSCATCFPNHIFDTPHYLFWQVKTTSTTTDDYETAVPEYVRIFDNGYSIVDTFP